MDLRMRQMSHSQIHETVKRMAKEHTYHARDDISLCTSSHDSSNNKTVSGESVDGVHVGHRTSLPLASAKPPPSSRMTLQGIFSWTVSHVSRAGGALEGSPVCDS